MTERELIEMITNNPNFATSEEIARVFHSDEATPVLWHYNINLHSKKDKYSHFKIPEAVVVFKYHRIPQMLKVLKDDTLATNAVSSLEGSKYFESEEECWNSFERELAESKEIIQQQIQKNVFDKILKAEGLISFRRISNAGLY